MYFTIPQDVLGVGSPAADTDVYLDENVQVTYTPQISKNKYGDGYSTIIPLGPVIRTISGSFSTRDATEIELIREYLNYLEGEPINGFFFLGQYANMVCKSFNRVIRAENVYSLQAEFKEEYQ